MAYLLWQLPELGGPNSSASLLSSAATAPGVMSSVKCSSSWKALVGQGSVFKQKIHALTCAQEARLTRLNKTLSSLVSALFLCCLL